MTELFTADAVLENASVIGRVPRSDLSPKPCSNKNNCNVWHSIKASAHKVHMQIDV